MRQLNKDQLLDICYGAAFLGSGGGGPFYTGLQLIKSLPDDVTVKVNDVDEVEPNKKTAMIGCIGAPEPMLEIQEPTSFINAFNKLNEAVNGQLGYVIPGEVGGLNSIAPIMVAIHQGISVIDGDGAGRAVPDLTMTTFAAASVSANPTVLANKKGQSISIAVETAAEAESFCRPILEVYGQQAGLAMWAMDAQILKQAVPIQGTLQLAENVGHILRYSSNSINEMLALLNNWGLVAEPFFVGIVQTPEEKTQGGFDLGTVILRNRDNYEVWVYNQNENLIAWDPQETAPKVTAPDSICYITTSGLPFSNADIEPLGIVGQEAFLIGIRARPQLQTGTILNYFKKALADLSFRVRYRPFPGWQKAETVVLPE